MVIPTCMGENEELPVAGFDQRKLRMIFNKQVSTILIQEVRSMSGRQHFWYWVFPTIVITILMSLFFSGVPGLVKLVNPKMIDLAANKEWGLLENVQLLIVMGITGVSAYATVSSKPAILKIGFGLLTLFSIVIFLEEIDYGYHFTEYFTGEGRSQLSEAVGIYNLHNINDNFGAIWFKRFVYLIMLTLFLVMPIWFFDKRHGLMAYLAPRPTIIIAASITIMSEVIARALVPIRNLSMDDLQMDIGEFSEVMIYYTFLLYLCQLAFEKKWQAKETK